MKQGKSLSSINHQGFSKQVMEEAYSYDQGDTPWNPPPYQHHTPRDDAYQSNGYGDAYYGYENPPTPYLPFQISIEEAIQLLCLERKELLGKERGINAQVTTLQLSVTRLMIESVNGREDALLHEDDVESLNHEEVHECLEEVEEENEDQEAKDVDQEVENEDKEPKGMEIVYSASFEATPLELPSKSLRVETDSQLRALCGVLDIKGMDSLVLDESRFITSGNQNSKPMVDIFTSFTTTDPRVWDPGKSFMNRHFWGVIAYIGAFRGLLNINWDPLEHKKFNHWWGFKDEFKQQCPT
ncbi:hypothetical protein PIB30_056349 [Stylosanthes scabra]|uniref:Uncharacterized protein n=1 Tax=Stylosanthes scabra TaxID=79078 RepID=A0ABU6YI32_9FABA|nr:hypothetical protein [Stylosanthes scabra]